MFFPERIKSIEQDDLVLEIGPGATPYHRSDVLLEMSYASEEELIAQSGHVGQLITNKQLVYYNGGRFPFEDKKFDYVVCSHVLEHVQNVPLFIAELVRVGKKGYLEFPTIYYEYLHNIEEHLNILLYQNGVICWCKKTETPIANLKELTDFFRLLQRRGYRMQSEVNELWHQGFEWSGDILQKRVSDWKSLCYSVTQIESSVKIPQPNFVERIGVGYSIKLLMRSIVIKIKQFFK